MDIHFHGVFKILQGDVSCAQGLFEFFIAGIGFAKGLHLFFDQIGVRLQILFFTLLMDQLPHDFFFDQVFYDTGFFTYGQRPRHVF